MTDLPDQKPAPQGLNSMPQGQNPVKQDQKPSDPPWMTPSTPAKATSIPVQADSSSTIKPTIEPIVEEKPGSPSSLSSPRKETKAPPQESTAAPMVYNPDNKKEKILKTGGIILSMSFLSLLSYFSLNLIDKNKVEKLASKSTTTEPRTEIQLPAEPTEPPPPPIVERKGEFALSVNNEILTWDEYEQTLDFHYQYWQTDTSTPKFKEDIKKILTERLIITTEAERLNIEINTDDLKAAEKSYFGHRLTKGEKAFPEIQKITQTEAYKNKLIEKLISWRSGGYILIQFAGPDADEVAEKYNESTKDYFRKKVESLHQKAVQGESIINIIEEIKKDEEILKANTGSLQSRIFEKHVKGSPIDKITWPDPQFEETIFSLQDNEVSSVFILKHPNNIAENKWIEFGFMFIKTTAAQNNNYEFFKDWLNQNLPKAEIISNI